MNPDNAQQDITKNLVVWGLALLFLLFVAWLIFGEGDGLRPADREAFTNREAFTKEEKLEVLQALSKRSANHMSRAEKRAILENLSRSSGGE